MGSSYVLEWVPSLVTQRVQRLCLDMRYGLYSLQSNFNIHLCSHKRRNGMPGELIKRETTGRGGGAPTTINVGHIQASIYCLRKLNMP